MKIEFKTHYVNEGSLEFDKHGRWRIDIYMFASFKTLPQYINSKPLYKNSFPVIIGRIYQRGGTLRPSINQLVRFTAEIPSIDNCMNGGVEFSDYFFNNDLDLLKKEVVDKLNEIHNLFKYAK